MSALRVMEDLSNVDLITKRATIVLTCGHADGQKAWQELSGADARRVATAYAQKLGLAGAATNHPARIFPVTDQGEEVGDPRHQKTADYRAELKLLAPIMP